VEVSGCGIIESIIPVFDWGENEKVFYLRLRHFLRLCSVDGRRMKCECGALVDEY
jgi:hypothetical protein